MRKKHIFEWQHTIKDFFRRKIVFFLKKNLGNKITFEDVEIDVLDHLK